MSPPSERDPDLLDRHVRWAVYQHFREHGTAPTAAVLAQTAGRPASDVALSLTRLAEAHRLVLTPGSADIWMAHPFSAVPTAYPVETASQHYWANCAWDALGIPALLHVDSRTRTACPDCGEPLEIEVRNRAATSTGAAVHFAVGPRRFWDDIGFT